MKASEILTCFVFGSKCQEAKTWVQQIEHHWQNNQPITIDVLVQLTDQTDTVILLEQWTVSILSSR